MSEPTYGMLGEIFAQLPSAVYRTTVTGRVVAGNAALVSLLGATSFDELKALDVRDLYADPARREWLIQRARAGMEIPVEDLQIRRLDGGLRWVRITSHPVHDETGAIAFFDGVMDDVTSLHAVDATLQQSNALLDTLTNMQDQYFAGVDLGVLFDGLLDDLLSSTGSAYGFIAQVLVDADGRFLRTWAMTDISWNEATRAMFAQYGPRGMEFHNLDTLFGRVVTTAEPVISNEPLKDLRAAGRPNGHPPLDSFFGMPILKGGEVKGVIALANRPGGYDDSLVHFLAPLAATVGSLLEAAMVEKAGAEARRRQQRSEELHLSIVESAADAIVTFGEGGRILLANAAAKQLMGVGDAELVGDRLFRFVPPASFRKAVERSRRAVESGASVELWVRRRDGSEHPVEATVVQVEGDDGHLTTVIARDITARKDLERALRSARDAAESAARAKDELLAGMSHELRMPLNAVIGLSAVLQRELHGPLTEKQREYVAQIESSGRHLLQVITNILDMAKAEAQRIEPKFARHDPATIVAEAVGLTGDLAVGKGLSLTTAIDPGLPAIWVDAIRARQIMLNLLSNAVKFTEAGGRIDITARVDDAAVAITVTDTGIGIAPENHDTIFEAFEQVDSTLARRFEGTGLGLALSRSLAELQGGSITVESTLGVGSAFTVTFPVAP